MSAHYDNKQFLFNQIIWMGISFGKADLTTGDTDITLYNVQELRGDGEDYSHTYV
jgi:hypothetical protein